ncbi:MAG TPA: TfoX/Sxy family protein [Desulfatiglandales bacterium]|nr:TfoX/Sxy family protein [Desulfatiglandales bacterium]
MNYSGLVEYLLDLLESFGDIQAKAMFGIVDKDTLYLKADDETRTDFEARGLKPFTYKRQGKEIALSYYQAPYEAVDDSEKLCEWARKAYAAALRSAGTKREKTDKRNWNNHC